MRDISLLRVEGYREQLMDAHCKGELWVADKEKALLTMGSMEGEGFDICAFVRAYDEFIITA